MAWLWMPQEVLRAYAEKLPEVRAMEMLSEIGAARIADAGRMKLAAAKRAQRRLERDADTVKRAPNPETIRAAGIRWEYQSSN